MRQIGAYLEYGGVFMVFEFFFQATVGITLGVIVVALPALYLYNLLFNPNIRRGR